MTLRLASFVVFGVLAVACGGNPPPAEAPGPLSVPGPRAVAPVSPADLVRPGHPAPTAAPAPAPAPEQPAAVAAAPSAPFGAQAAPAAAPEPSLFLRLGGAGPIAMVVDTFTARVHGDTALAPLFRGVDMDNFKRLMNELLCEATGGGCSYSGRPMRASHTGLNVTDAQFDTVVGYLSATLDQFNVPVREKNELLGLLAPMRSDIVGH